ncbi:hypothetical protein Q0Z83_048070 [Actinoplanes sichuanensis]|uniref:Uncharacterized protein n=1 Tax=Actinoplanes sichuanensis TaxID=512349 RepID=A0ABW4AQ51_9ACTN|nr:hypothetical protein [Actinoplanes sichuanensis]BEL06616.1 hypothetical protein Q0Z83_048070 [Actinoplanes sichuanensis]
MKRVLITLVVVAVLGIAAIGVYGQVRRMNREAARQATIDRFVATHPLETTAAAIDWERRHGRATHFALVPQNRPPALVRMDPSESLVDGGVTDIYTYDGLKVVVNFTAVPGAHPCGDQPCIRDADFTVRTEDAPSLQHAAVWITGATSPVPAEIRQFWAKTAWVPIADAQWYIELAEKGSITLPD